MEVEARPGRAPPWRRTSARVFRSPVLQELTRFFQDISYKDFFDVAVRQNPKPKTVAIVAADAEFGLQASKGARENAKATGLTVVYDRRYPSATTDLVPVVRAMAETNPDLVIVCSYPPDSVGMVRAVNETGFKPKMIGGAMVGLQNTAIKGRLGPLLRFIDPYSVTDVTRRTISVEKLRINHYPVKSREEFTRKARLKQEKKRYAGVDYFAYHDRNEISDPILCRYLPQLQFALSPHWTRLPEDRRPTSAGPGSPRVGGGLPTQRETVPAP